MGTAKTAWVIALVSVVLCGCPATAPPRPTFETGSKPVPVPTVVATPCIDATEVPEPYVRSFVAGGDEAQHAAAASADLRWLVPRYEAARAKLTKCAQEVK